MKSTSAVLMLASAVLALSFAAAPAATAQSSQSSSSPAATSSSTHTSKKRTSTHRHRYSRREPTQKAPTPQRISEIQSALSRGGYYDGDPNGKWDSNTIDAMQKFQSANGLTASGKIDSLSLQKLGLGSDIAGVSAPRPLPPAGSAPVPASSAPPTPPSAHLSATAPAPSSSASAASTPNADALANNSSPAPKSPQR
ncbi:MAG: peptidoglycan-binding domain-containing protein [Candidatus Acidiferrales bacterium]